MAAPPVQRRDRETRRAAGSGTYARSSPDHLSGRVSPGAGLFTPRFQIPRCRCSRCHNHLRFTTPCARLLPFQIRWNNHLGPRSAYGRSYCRNSESGRWWPVSAWRPYTTCPGKPAVAFYHPDHNKIINHVTVLSGHNSIGV